MELIKNKIRNHTLCLENNLKVYYPNFYFQWIKPLFLEAKFIIL